MTGRHRRATDTRRRAVQAAAAGGVAASAAVLVPTPAYAASPEETLRAIAACESSGDPRAVGPVTEAGGHFGLFQFDVPTWRSVGGSGNPAHASAAEQTDRAHDLLAARGTQPWLASQHCWGDEVAPVRAGAATVTVTVTERTRTPAAARTHDAGKHAAGTRDAATVLVRRGDSLAKIAAAHGTSWRALYNRNRAVVGPNPALIVPGQRLTI